MSKRKICFLLVIFSLFTLFIGLCFGSVSLQLTSLFQRDHLDSQLFLQIRAPRVMLAFLIGGSIAVSGVVIQSVLSNPLASAYTLGISSGASLGAAAILISGLTFFSSFTLPFTGFMGALLTIFLVIALSRLIDNELQSQSLLLIGMVLTFALSAVLTIITFFFKDYLQQLIFWQMGSFSGSTWQKVGLFSLIAGISCLILWQKSAQLDLLSLGEEEALMLGVEVKHLKKSLLVFASLLIGSAVSLVGVIGFIDLIAPHIVRKYLGALHRYLIPCSFLMGGCLMVIADLLARTLLLPREIPVGAITAIIGAPFFMYVYMKNRGENR